MKQVKDIINDIKILKEQNEKEMNTRKENINNNYFMAKIDIKVIENKEDINTTLDKIIEELEELQIKIIERNRK